jgi:PadR family transcriptional regulator PadR
MNACFACKGKRKPTIPDPAFLLTFNMRVLLIAYMNDPRCDVLQGTLDLLVLKTLDVLGAQHGFGIARRIEQVSANKLALNQGTLYPALLRLEQQQLIASEWGTSTNNRRARFYSLTAKGRRQLAAEIEKWQRASGAVNSIVADAGPLPALG